MAFVKTLMDCKTKHWSKDKEMTARSIQINARSKLFNEHDFIEYLDECIAEIRAEALKEAEDIVCALWPDQDAIRAAILAGEVKE